MATTGPVVIPLTPDLAAVAANPTPDTGPQEGENTYRWATVTGVSPLRIQLDGETSPMPIAPDSLIPLAKLAATIRVWVQLFGRRVLILGAANGGVPDPPLPPIGAILEWGGNAAPANYLICDGSSLLRTTYAALYAVIGTTYGSVDGTHFNLPNKTNRVSVGAGGIYARGATGGSATATILWANLANHSHNLSSTTISNSGDHGHVISGSSDFVGDHNHSVANQSTRSDIQAAAGSVVAANAGGTTGGSGGHSHGLSLFSANNGTHAHSLSGTSDSAGSDTPMSIMQPYLASLFIIRAT